MAPAKKNKKKRYPGCLAHAVIVAFYSIAATRRQPNLVSVAAQSKHHPCSISYHGDVCFERPHLVYVEWIYMGVPIKTRG